MSAFRGVRYTFLFCAFAFLSTAPASDWVETWSGVGNGEDKAVAVQVDAAGNVYVLANITDLQGDDPPVSVATIGVVKYDAAGNWKWDWPYVLREDDEQPRAVGFVLDENNHAIYVAGYCERANSDSGVEFLVFKIVEENGEPNWGWTFDEDNHAVTYGFAEDEDDIPSGMALGPNGSFIAIAGTSATGDGDRGQDYSVLSLYPDGSPVGPGFWAWNEGGTRITFDDSATAVAVGEDGVIYVTGSCFYQPDPQEPEEHLTFCTMAWQSNGNGAPGWNTDATYGGDVLEAVPTRIAVSGGCAVVAGTFVSAEDEENRGILTACYNGYVNRSEVKFELSDEENSYDVSLADLAAPPQPDTFYLACSTSVPGKAFAVLNYRISHNGAVPTLHLEQERYNDDAGAPVALACSWDEQSHDTSTFLVGTLSDNSLRTIRFWSRKLVPRCYDHLEYGNTNTAADIATPPWGAGSWAAVAGTHGSGSSADVLVYRRDMDYSWAWSQVASMLQGNKRKNVKDGGCLAYDYVDGAPYVYALKGNNTYEFYRYNFGQNALSWEARESIPAIGRSGKKKRVKKGAAIAALPSGGTLYAVKGNGTFDFWAYDPATRVWSQKADVPLGFVGKPVKEGAGLATAADGLVVYVYLLKGSGTNEFFRYNIQADAWETMASAPTGPSEKPFKNGSALTYDNTLCGDIYALKGSYNEFFAYSISGKTWTTKSPLPFIGRTKAKDGASLAYHNGQVFALKGGNTNEFWAYDPNQNWWGLEEAVPTGPKKVKAGGALVSVPPANQNALYALRGNNTLEFWRCHEVANPSTPGAENPSSPGANEVAVATCANATAATPHWNHAGTWVAYCRAYQGEFKLFKVPAGGGQPTELASLSAECAPVWSPNDSSIAFEYESGGYAQVAVVPSSGGQVNVLTSDACDHNNPVWSTSGSGILYSRFDASMGYDEVYHVSSTGGSEQAISSSSYDHEKPQVLSSTEVTCERDGDDVYTGIYKLNVNTGQETELSAGSADYSGCCVAPGARLCAAEKTDQNGFSQIVIFSADGGTGTVITSGEYDFLDPALTNDGAILSCLRQGSSGSAVCVIDLLEGTCQTFTDALADREAPDVHALNSAQHLVSTVYTRESDIYRVDYLSSSGLVVAPNGFRAGIARDPEWEWLWT